MERMEKRCSVLYVTVLEATDLAPALRAAPNIEWLPGLRKMRKPAPQLEVSANLVLRLGDAVWRTADVIVPGLAPRGGLVGEDYLFDVASAHDCLDITCVSADGEGGCGLRPVEHM